LKFVDGFAIGFYEVVNALAAIHAISVSGQLVAQTLRQAARIRTALERRGS